MLSVQGLTLTWIHGIGHDQLSFENATEYLAAGPGWDADPDRLRCDCRGGGLRWYFLAEFEECPVPSSHFGLATDNQPIQH
jgi:hypothetical protein